NHMEDRASMSQSRELRTPLFDWRLIEFALSLPIEQTLGCGWTKRMLRLVGQTMLPPEIVWRKSKTGHFTATREWLVSHCGAVGSSLQRGSLVFTGGFLDGRKLLPQWDAFWSGGASGLTIPRVVAVLALELWLRSFSGSLRL